MFSTADGPVMEPSVSVPTAAAHRFAAAASAGAGARAPRRVTQIVGVVRTSAARAPTDCERIGLNLIVPEVCPFAEIRFTENDCASGAQFLNQRRVGWNPATINCE